MKRRELLGVTMSAALLQAALPAAALANGAAKSAAKGGQPGRARLGTPGWPAARDWQSLRTQTGGRLLALSSPFARGQSETVRAEALAGLKNPYYIGDNPALTQTSGWQDAWTSRASAYAVAAQDALDVAAAVKFARRHNLRLVVKGGGHSYFGASNAPDSLLVWTRKMNKVTMVDAFVAQGCPQSTSQPAVHVGAGAMWADAYAEVTTRGGRYVQGGGCTTVGVAGAGVGRRLRQFFERLRYGRGQPARGRGGNRRRRSAYRQRLH